MSEEFGEALAWSLTITACMAAVPVLAVLCAGLVELRADGRAARVAQKQGRIPTWRDCEPSRWRGFFFTLRKRPSLAVRWVAHRYFCGPVVKLARGVRALGRGVSRALDWLSEFISPALRASCRARAWGRVELAKNFNRKGGVA